MLSVVASERQAWPLRTPPFDDELLSSFLIRSALRHGQSPQSFCALHLSPFSIWNRDIDRSASSALLTRLAQVSRFDEQDLLKLVLVSPTAAGERPEGVAPWVNAVGVYHRVRRRFGQLFCPFCLRDAPYFRKHWRYSAAIYCERHVCSLYDACPACGAPITPHRQSIHIALCGLCSADLRSGVKLEAEVPLDEQLALQRRLVLAGLGISTTLGTQVVSGPDLLLGAGRLMRIVGAAKLRFDSPSLANSQLGSALSAGLERCRVRERRRLFDLLGDCLSEWPDRFRQESASLRLAQSAFPDRELLPDWLAEEIARLPGGHRWRYRGLPGQSRMSVALDAISSSGALNWREQRARALLKAARKQSK